MTPTMRITHIDLDDNELPETVHLQMTWDVWDRLCRDHKLIRSVARQNPSNPDMWHDAVPMRWVATTAKHYGALP